jgi:alpha-glucosidase
MRPMFAKRAVFSDESKFYRKPVQPEAGEDCTIRIRTLKNNADEVYFISGSQRLLMTLAETAGAFDYYEITISLTDEVVKYYSTISGKLGKKDKYSSIYCYFSNESWLDPLENKSDFDLTPVYKNGKYDSYICNSKYGKFIVDHFSDNFNFTMYALDESIINDVLSDIELKYE